MQLTLCSCAALALGSKELSKNGAIVTRLGAIEEMAGMVHTRNPKP